MREPLRRTSFLGADSHPCTGSSFDEDPLRICVLDGGGTFVYKTSYTAFSLVYGQDVPLLIAYS